MKIKTALYKTYNNFKQTLPILLGVILLLSLIQTILPKEFFLKIFTGNRILDPLIGAIIGSVAAGNPVTSYIIGGELQEMGVGLLGITAFILAWVTVGVVQLPAEILMLGKKFAITRNIISFITAIIISMLIIMTLGIIR